MKTNRVGLIVFWIFVLYMVGMGFVASWWVVPTYRNLAPDQIGGTIWAGDSLLFLIWALSTPLGAVLACVGLLIYVRAKNSLIWLFGAGVTLLLVIIGFLPIPGYYPPVFGIGGGLVMALFLITLWFWAKRRPLLEGSARTAANFQLVGYVFFLVGMWYLCGLLGPPAYLLNTDKVQQFGSLQGAQVSAVQIFIYFILGWLFTFLSQHKARKLTLK
ncbi:hypothetical protein ACFLX7_01450 [Chloroflexota bacterium]